MKQTIELLKLCDVIIDGRNIIFTADNINVAKVKFHIGGDYNLYIDRFYLFNKYIEYTEDMIEFISEIYTNNAEDL